MDAFAPDGRRWKGRRDVRVCVGMCAMQPEVHSAGDETRHADSPAVTKEGRRDTIANHRCTGGIIAYMTKIAGTLSWTVGEMLRLICYKHSLLRSKSPQKKKTSKASHRQKQLQLVTLSPMLLGPIGAFICHASHPSWQAASHYLLCKSCCLSQHTDGNRRLWYAEVKGYHGQASNKQLAPPWVTTWTQSWMGVALSGEDLGQQGWKWNRPWESWDAEQSSGWCWRQGSEDGNFTNF